MRELGLDQCFAFLTYIGRVAGMLAFFATVVALALSPWWVPAVVHGDISCAFVKCVKVTP